MSNAVKNIAALAGGKAVKLEIPASLVDSLDGEALLFLKLLMAEIEILKERTDDNRVNNRTTAEHLDRAIRDRGFQSSIDVALRMDQIEETQSATRDLMAKMVEGQNLVLKYQAAPSVPQYDKKGKFISSRKVITE